MRLAAFSAFEGTQLETVPGSSTSGGIVRVMTPGRNGGSAWKFDEHSGNEPYFFTLNGATGLKEFDLRLYLYFDEFPNAGAANDGTQFLGATLTTDTTTCSVVGAVDSTGKLFFRNIGNLFIGAVPFPGGAVGGGATIQLAVRTWYRVNIYMKSQNAVAAAPASTGVRGIIKCQVFTDSDNALVGSIGTVGSEDTAKTMTRGLGTTGNVDDSVAEHHGLNKNGFVSSVNLGTTASGGWKLNGQIRIADFVADDTNCPGAGSVTVLRPAANGTYQEWAQNDYRTVRNLPALTTRQLQSAGASTRISFQVDSPADLGITGTIKSIRVAAGTSSGEFAAPRDNWAFGLRVNGVDSYDPTAITATTINGGWFRDATGLGLSVTDTFEVICRDGSGAGVNALLGKLVLIIDHESPNFNPKTLEPDGIQMKSFTIIGTGATSDFTLPFDFPCVPDLLIVRPDNAGGVAAIWHRGMGVLGDHGHTSGGTANGTICNVRRNGFTLRNQLGVNDAAEVNHVFALADPLNRMGQWHKYAVDGNRPDDRNILTENATFTPEVVLDIGLNGGGGVTSKQYFRTSTYAGDSASQIQSNAAAAANLIQAFAVGSFQLGTTIQTDTDSAAGALIHHAAAVLRKTGAFLRTTLMDRGSYAGDGGASKTIPLGFTSDVAGAGFILVVPENTNARHCRFGSQTGGANFEWNAAVLATVTGIIDFTRLSFTVANPLNALGVTYHWVAFAGGTDLTATEEFEFDNEGGIGLTWVEVTYSDSQTIPYAKVALPDPLAYYYGFKEDRVTRWGSIQRALSDQSGQHEGVDFRWTMWDTDRTLRGKLGALSSKYFNDRLVTVRMIDDPSRRLLVTPRTVLKGQIVDYSPVSQLLFQFQIKDLLASRFNGTSEGELIPKRTISTNDFPNAASKFTDSDGTTHEVGAVGKPVPIIYGRITDLNVGVEDGDGQCPGIYVGISNIGPTGWVDVGTPYHTWVLAGHACKAVSGIYTDNGDTGQGTVPASSIGDLSAVSGNYASGADWIVPGLHGIPAYEDRNGHRYCIVYGKVGSAGPDIAAEYAPTINSGSYPVAFDVSGIEDVGDGTGTLITDGLLQYRHFMQNWGLGDYQWSAWLDTEMFGDDVLLPVMDDASFDAASAVAHQRIAGGYRGDFVIGWSASFHGTQLGGERLRLRDLVARFNVSFDVDSFPNHKSQFSVSMMDDSIAAYNAATDLKDVVDIKEATFNVKPDMGSHFNVVPFRHTQDYFDRDTEGWRSVESGILEYSDPAAITNSRNQRKAADTQLYYMVRGNNRSGDSTEYNQGTLTGADVAQRYLTRHKEPPQIITFTTFLAGLNLELGATIRLTHFEGLTASGWSNWPARITRHIADPDQFTVDLECFDMARMFDGAFILGDETALAGSWPAATTAARRYGYLGDETTGQFSTGDQAKRLR